LTAPICVTGVIGARIVVVAVYAAAGVGIVATRVRVIATRGARTGGRHQIVVVAFTVRG